MNLATARAALIPQIDNYIAQNKMSESAFGRLIMNNPNFVYDLKGGRIPRRETVNYLCKRLDFTVPKPPYEGGDAAPVIAAHQKPLAPQSIKAIGMAVAAYYDIPLDIFFSRRRDFRYCHPRQLAMYLARDLTCKSTPQIGAVFGRDHSTVIVSCQQVERRLAANPNVARDLSAIKAIITAPAEPQAEAA